MVNRPLFRLRAFLAPALALFALAAVPACGAEAAAPEGAEPPDAAPPDGAESPDEAGTASAGLSSLTPYPVINKNSNKALEIGGGSTLDGSLSNQWTFVNNQAAVPWQFWRFRQIGSFNEWEIVNHHSGKCLEVGAGNANDGALTNQWACAGLSHQRWRLVPVNPAFGLNEYEVVNVNSGKCLEVGASNTNDGALTNQWACVGVPTQIWRIPLPSAPACKPPGAFTSGDCSDCCSKACTLFGSCF